MVELDLKALVTRLNDHTKTTLHTAAGACISRGHYEVTLEHHLSSLMDETRSDIPLILQHFDIQQIFLRNAQRIGGQQHKVCLLTHLNSAFTVFLKVLICRVHCHGL